MIWIWVSGLFFALSHSLLAANRCKQYLYQHGWSEQRYRLIYSIIAVLATVIWILFVRQLPDSPLYQTHGLLWGILIALQGMGIFIALAAIQPIDGLAFLGLRTTKQGVDPFVVRGIYRRIRHPMYSGAMLILLAMPAQTSNGLSFTLLICLYFIIGVRLEEARMIAAHPDYADYRHRVPAFVPNLKSP